MYLYTDTSNYARLARTCVGLSALAGDVGDARPNVVS